MFTYEFIMQSILIEVVELAELGVVDTCICIEEPPRIVGCSIPAE